VAVSYGVAIRQLRLVSYRKTGMGTDEGRMESEHNRLPGDACRHRPFGDGAVRTVILDPDLVANDADVDLRVGDTAS
jgi:hypothetical protein